MQNLKLKSKIVECGFTYEEVSRMSSVSKPTVQKAVNGGAIKIQTAVSIAKALGSTVDELFNN